MSLFIPCYPKNLTKERYNSLKNKKTSSYSFYLSVPFDVIDDNLVNMAVDIMESYADVYGLNALHLIYMADKIILMRIADETDNYIDFLSCVLKYSAIVSKREFVHPFDIDIPSNILAEQTSNDLHCIKDKAKEYFRSKSRNEVLLLWQYLTRTKIQIISLKSGAIKGNVFSDTAIMQLLNVTEKDISDAISAIESIYGRTRYRRKLKNFLD